MELDLNLPATTAGRNGWPTPPDSKQGVRQQITHDLIIDFMMTNPGCTYKQVGEAFGFTMGGIAVIVNSDAFRARYEVRKTELIDPILIQRMEDMIKGLAAQSIQILQRKLETSDDANFALKVFDSTTRAAGYGVSKPQVINQQAFVVHLPGPASSSAEWASKFAAGNAPILKPNLDNTVSEVSTNE